MNREIKQVCVYGGAKSGNDPEFIMRAKEFGSICARDKIKIVYGGGDKGMMGALADGGLEAGGDVEGFIPLFMVENDWHHKGVPNMQTVETMHQRKSAFLKNTDAVIALPGGIGTLEELAEAITWRSLELIKMPIILLNTRKYYEPLVTYMQHMKKEGFMKESDFELFRLVDSPNKVIAAIREELQKITVQ